MARRIGPNSPGNQRYGYAPGDFALQMAHNLKMTGLYPSPVTSAPAVTVDIPPRPMPGCPTRPGIDPVDRDDPRLHL